MDKALDTLMKEIEKQGIGHKIHKVMEAYHYLSNCHRWNIPSQNKFMELRFLYNCKEHFYLYDIQHNLEVELKRNAEGKLYRYTNFLQGGKHIPVSIIAEMNMIFSNYFSNKYAFSVTEVCVKKGCFPTTALQGICVECPYREEVQSWIKP